jgi:hypothetical protein
MKIKSNFYEVLMTPNEQFKSSVFSTLFSDHAVLRELYSALEGVEVPEDTPIDINTLSKIFVKGQINDLSFTIDNRLIVLIEHQSTINNNMPLRMLLYIADVYQRIINQKEVYQKRLIKLPSPEFIVLYNGIEPYPDHMELRLSAAFKDVEDLKIQEGNKPSLELVARVYNINYGHNSKLLEKSGTLNHYSLFINKIREYRNMNIPLEESMNYAVKYCKENGILKEFLGKYEAEVIKMLWKEWTVEDEMEALKEEAWEEGLAEGRAEGMAEGIAEGMEKGRAEGRAEARAETREEVLDLLKQGLSIKEIEEHLINYK